MYWFFVKVVSSFLFTFCDTFDDNILLNYVSNFYTKIQNLFNNNIKQQNLHVVWLSRTLAIGSFDTCVIVYIRLRSSPLHDLRGGFRNVIHYSCLEDG